MEQTAEKIKIESDTFALKRDYKYALENLAITKNETAEILTVLEKAKRDLESAQEELTKIKNQISQEKLDWASHRHGELQELEGKKAEAENVIKRKGELNQQEEELRKIELSTVDVRNETRQLELKLKQDSKDLETREKTLLEAHKKVKKEEEKLIKDKQDFKKKVAEVLKEIEKI